MKSDKSKPKTIDDYIQGFNPVIRAKLSEVRAVIKKTVPEASETINYGIPTFTLNGNLVHFAAFKNHLGFYPTPDGIEAFKKELASYEGAKGSVQFPYDRPLPLPLIAKIVKYRVKASIAKDKLKKK